MNIDELQVILVDALSYARDRNYIGYDKHDGMSSRIRSEIPFDNRWVNLVFQEGSKRAPVNVRPMLLVEQRPNPKGLSLFSMANYTAYRLSDEDRYHTEAIETVNRVISYDNDEYAGFGIGHTHQLQGFKTRKETNVPGIVQTSYAVKALLRLSAEDNSYREIATGGACFVREELDPNRTSAGVRVKYNPTDKPESYTLNANAVAARMFIDLYERLGDDEYAELATEILSYVAENQNKHGGWEYKDPPSASHLGMDNYHNGFIIESFLRYQEVVDPDAFTKTVNDALDFYRTVLYDDNGAPCWDEESKYPRDIHAAAQGIVTFTHAGDLEFARRIIDWTIENLYAGDGQFYYQKRRWYTKRFTLMRWCQAWMTYAISEHLRCAEDDYDPFTQSS